MNRSKSQTAAVAPLLAYFLTLIIFLVGSNYLSGRVWGINIWDAAPGAITMFVVGLIAGALIWFLPGHSFPQQENNSNTSRRTYYIISLALIIIFTLAFYIFRAQTHFLGDGYTLISLLGADNPLIKQREIGESLIHIWVKDTFKLSGESGALTAFRIISISAGALYLSALVIAAGKLFARNVQRILFALGLICAGNAPLFFGYVENYSVFALSVLLVTLIGALSLSGVVSKLWTIPALAFSIWLHTLGVTLIPGVIFALARDTRFAQSFLQWSPKWKLLVTISALALIGASILYFHRTNIFFEAALLPITTSRFTVEGYTLFSPAHIADIANLLILLCPWALVAMALMLTKPIKTQSEEKSSPIIRFLVILSVSTLGAVFVFDPKIGMPRDWDLFSFAAIPVTVLFYYILLDNRHSLRFVIRIAALSVVASLLVLIPRISVSLSEQGAVSQIESFIELDKQKNRTAMQLLQQFHLRRGNTGAAAELGERYTKTYPEVNLTLSASQLGRQGRIDSAVTLLRKTLKINQTYAPAYLNLGRAFRARRNYDSALSYLEIADGLNPYNEYIITELGQVYQEFGDTFLKNGKLERARELYRHAVELGQDSALLDR